MASDVVGRIGSFSSLLFPGALADLWNNLIITGIFPQNWHVFEYCLRPFRKWGFEARRSCEGPLDEAPFKPPSLVSRGLRAVSKGGRTHGVRVRREDPERWGLEGRGLFVFSLTVEVLSWKCPWVPVGRVVVNQEHEARRGVR